MKKTILFLLPFLLLMSFFALGEETAFYLESVVTEGPEGSFVICPVLTGGDEQICEKVNAQIRELGGIDSALSLLSGITPGSAGLKVTWESNYSRELSCPQVLSLVIRSEGKMPKGRPGIRMFPMTFDLSTGEQILFSDLCTDEDAARQSADLLCEVEIEPEISDYMRASLITPVPCDDFYLDGRGNIVFYYASDRFSFVSGTPGAIALSLRDMEGIDSSENSFCAKALIPGKADPAISLLGASLEETLSSLRAPFDSEWFPEGEEWHVEEALFRGTGIISTDGCTVTALSFREFFPEGTVFSPGSALEGSLNRPFTPEESDYLDLQEGKALQYEKNGIRFTCFFDREDALTLVLCEKGTND